MRLRLRSQVSVCLVSLLMACGGDDDDAGSAGASGGGSGGSGPGGSSAAGSAGAAGTKSPGGSGGQGTAGKAGAAGKAGSGGTAGGGGTAGSGGSGSGASGSGPGGSGGQSGAGPGGSSAQAGQAGSAQAGSTSGGGSGGQGPVTPTVSSWMGTNVSGDLVFVDTATQLAGFDMPAAQKDAHGYPAPGQSGQSNTDIGFVLPSGTYKLSYKGSGTLAVGGVGQLAGAFTTVGDEHRADVQITGSQGDFGKILTLKVTNGAGQSVSDIHLLYPGFDHGSTQVFLPKFLDLLRPFRSLRFMDWEATNGSTITDWKDHPTTDVFGTSGFGAKWEHIVALVNQTGKDAWVTVPELADDAYTTQMATYLATHLDFSAIAQARAAQGNTAPFELILETSNETWNGSFSATKTFVATANANPSLYPGTYDGAYGPSWMSGNPDLMKAGQVEGDRLAKQAALFRQAFQAAGHEDAIAPVLSGWALGAVYSDVALRFIKAHHGDPKTIIKYVAIAPYFGVDDAQTGSLSALFTAMQGGIASVEPTFNDFKKLVDEYGLQMSAYEGGQGLSGTTNQPIKHLAQHDQRMYDAYTSHFALWQKVFGKARYMHFTLAGTPGVPEWIFQFGYWGSIGSVLEDTTTCGQNLPTLTGNEALADVVHHCPKYRSLAEQVP